jgi:hypothetical protein
MLLPTALILSSPAGAAWVYVPAGWTTTEQGYWGTVTDGRDMLAMLQSYRQEAELWERTVTSMQEEVAVAQVEMTAQLEALRTELSAERQAWRREIAAERGRTWLYVVGALGLGFVIGR